VHRAVPVAVAKHSDFQSCSPELPRRQIGHVIPLPGACALCCTVYSTAVCGKLDMTIGSSC
jgi:hypothetical protein